MQVEADKGLLETLKDNIGCPYVSALREQEYRQLAARQAGALALEAYTLKEWNDAVGYLTGEAHIFGSAGEARSFLEQWDSNTG